MSADVEPPLTPGLRALALRELARLGAGGGVGEARPTWRRRDEGRGSTEVWQLQAGPAALFLKRHHGARGFTQERRALSEWFAGSDGARDHAALPELIAVDENERTMLLTALPGARPTEDELEAAHEAAGRFLAALQQRAVVDEDPLPLAEALRRRARAWMKGCEQALAPAEQRTLVELAADLGLEGAGEGIFAEAVRVPCHRDFVADNWLWSEAGLGIVDFEHARADLGLVDLAKLCVDDWRRRPELARAFFTGFGRRPSMLERRQLGAVVALHGVASLVWGLRHADAGFVALGHRALAATADGLPWI